MVQTPLYGKFANVPRSLGLNFLLGGAGNYFTDTPLPGHTLLIKDIMVGPIVGTPPYTIAAGFYTAGPTTSLFFRTGIATSRIFRNVNICPPKSLLFAASPIDAKYGPAVVIASTGTITTTDSYIGFNAAWVSDYNIREVVHRTWGYRDSNGDIIAAVGAGKLAVLRNLILESGSGVTSATVAFESTSGNKTIIKILGASRGIHLEEINLPAPYADSKVTITWAGGTGYVTAVVDVYDMPNEVPLELGHVKWLYVDAAAGGYTDLWNASPNSYLVTDFVIDATNINAGYLALVAQITGPVDISIAVAYQTQLLIEKHLDWFVSSNQTIKARNTDVDSAAGVLIRAIDLGANIS